VATKLTVIPRQVGPGFDKDRRAEVSDPDNLNMYNRYNRASSAVPTLAKSDMEKCENICGNDSRPAVYTKAK